MFQSRDALRDAFIKEACSEPRGSGIDLSRASNLVAKGLEVCHIPRKEVIHEQLPLPMPCYDLLLITDLTVAPIFKTRGLRVLSALLS